jgi:hypothetical protein
MIQMAVCQQHGVNILLRSGRRTVEGFGLLATLEKSAVHEDIGLLSFNEISRPGDLTTRGTNNTVDVTVVAIVKGMGMMSQFSCFMNEVTLRQLYQLKDDTTGALQIYLPTADLGEIKKVQARLRDGLTKAGYSVLDEDPRAFWFKFENVSREPWVGQRLDLTNWHAIEFFQLG